MYYECCVCKCSRQDAVLHHFPTYSEKRLNKWLNSLQRCDLVNMLPEHLTKRFVCAKHFERRFFGSKARLKISAYPTLFTEDEILSGIPIEEDGEAAALHEHSYAGKKHFDHTYCKPPEEGIDSTTTTFLNLQRDSQIEQPDPVSSEAVVPDSCVNILKASQCTMTRHQSVSEIIDSPTATFLDLQVSSQNGFPEKEINDMVKNDKKVKCINNCLANKVKNMPPEYQILYKKYKKVKKQADYFRRANKSLKFSKEKCFEKMTKGLSNYAKMIIEMQINLCMKKKRGCRFTKEEKLLSLEIMKRSPNCYRFLSKIFILPSKTTLNKIVSQINLESVT